jgi:tetratricopeptide (TPR) repeat protein
MRERAPFNALAASGTPAALGPVAATAAALAAAAFALGGALLAARPIPSAAADSGDPVDRGAELLGSGHYTEALAALSKSSAPPAKVLMARALYKVGKYEDSVKLALATGKAAGSGALAADAYTVAGEALFEVGRDADALDALDKAAAADPDGALRAYLVRGTVKEDLGDRAAAVKDYYKLYDAYEAKRARTKDQLALVAAAAGHVGGAEFHTANEVYRDEAGADLKTGPWNFEALVGRAELFLAKYDSAYAVDLLEKAMELNPADPRALALLARAILEDTNQAVKVLIPADRALVTNGRHPGALAVKTMVALDDEDWPGALAMAERCLATNPRHLYCHALKATALYLLDRDAAFAAEEKLTLGLNPKYAELYNVVSDYGIKFHRYEEVPALLEKAVAIDPKNARALTELGLNASRLGDDAKAKELFERSYALDKFDIRTVNMSNLYAKYIDPYYEWLDVGMWHIRAPKAQRELLKLYVPDLLDRAEKVLTKKYGGKRAYTPTFVELFDDMRYFATRTIGVPGLLATGVCFGRVITSMSPSTGLAPRPGDAFVPPFDWSDTLWHELSHTYHIKMSRGRVPRWLTEGMASYEEVAAFPRWARHNDRDLYWALKSKRLRGVADMSLAFTRARGFGDILAAYYNASLVAEFLVKKAGMPKVNEMLLGYGKGKTTPELLKAATGMTPAAFDAAYWDWLARDKLAYLKPGFDVDFYGYPDLVVAEEALKRDPTNPDRLADLAVALMIDSKYAEAMAAGKEALKRDPKNKVSLLLLADASLGGTKPDLVLAKGYLRELLDAGGDGYAVRSRLAMTLQGMKDWDGALEHALAAMRFDPSAVDPHMVAAEAYKKRHDMKAALGEMETVVALNQHDVHTMKELMKYYRGEDRWADVARIGAMAVEVALFDPDLHEWYAEALLESGAYKTPEGRATAKREAEALGLAADYFFKGGPEAGPVRKRAARMLDRLR